jgi:hypothetical protein
MLVCLEIDIEKTKHILLSLNQNTGPNRDSEIANRSFVTVQILWNDSNKSNLIRKEIKRILNSDIACYNSVQNLCLLVCYPKT